jgi:predicted amidohydrolase
MRVALAQMFCGWGEVEANLDRMAVHAERAAGEGADLLLFPELSIPGIWKSDRVAAVSEPVNGPSLARVRRLAHRLSLAIGAGFSEQAEGKPFNAYAVISRDGEIAGVYRKNFIPELEAPFWQPHSARPGFDVLGWPSSIALCWDNRHPELHRHYARLGTRLLIMPHAWDSDALNEEGKVIEYHSMDEIVRYHQRTEHRLFKTHDQMRDDFHAYIPSAVQSCGFWGLFVNQAGRPHESVEFVGPSFVVNPAGQIVAETEHGAEQILFADVGPA